MSLRLAYRLVGWRLGPAYRIWVLADVRSPSWPLRAGGVVALAVLVPAFAVGAVAGVDLVRLAFPVVAVLVLSALRLRALRERALRQQGLRPDGDLDPTATWYADDEARARRNTVSAASTVSLVVAALVLLAVTAP